MPSAIISTDNVIGIPRRRSTHGVEERVLGIVVVIEVAGEAFALEEDASRSASNVGAGQRAGELVEARDPRVDIETGMRVRGDAQRGDVERHLGGRAVDRRDESLAGSIAADGSVRRSTRPR